MVWRDEECVDFDDFRSSQLKNTGPTEEASEENRDSDENEEEDKFNPPDMEDEEPLINLDSIVLQDAEENFTLPPPSAQRQQLTKNQALSTQMEAKVSLPKKY